MSVRGSERRNLWAASQNSLAKHPVDGLGPEVAASGFAERDLVAGFQRHDDGARIIDVKHRIRAARLRHTDLVSEVMRWPPKYRSAP